MTNPKSKHDKMAALSFGAVYPLYLAKVQRKGRTQDELDQVITWFTGYDTASIQTLAAEDTSFATFLQNANITPQAFMITGVICGDRIENLDDTLVRQVRQFDKVVDELAKGRPLSKIIRQPA